jgi:hypothetical protein
LVLLLEVSLRFFVFLPCSLFFFAPRPISTTEYLVLSLSTESFVVTHNFPFKVSCSALK